MGLFIGIIDRQRNAILRSQYEWQLHLIADAKMAATKAASDLLQVATDFEGDSLIAKKLEQRKYKLKILEEKLDQRKADIETKLQALKAIESSNQQMIDNGIQRMAYKVA